MRTSQLSWFTATFLFSLTAYGRFNWEGSLKTIGQYQRLHEQGIYQKDGLWLNEDRLRLQASWAADWLRLELADELSFVYQAENATYFPIPDLFPTSAWNAGSTVYQETNHWLKQRLDRAYIQFSFSSLDLRIGKQVIDEGVGHIFSAVSQVPRYPLVFIDTEYPKTEDAVALLWKGPLTLEVRYLPKTAEQTGDSVHIRAKGNRDGYDIAVTGGRTDDKPYIGFEAAGNLGDALLRAELVGYEWGNDQRAVQGLLGVDHTFSKSLTGQFEIFHNGFGSEPPYRMTAFRHRSAPYRGKWYFGSVLKWEITPRWKSTFATIVNLNEPSALFNLVFEWSIIENLDVLLGQYYGVGKSDAEFGGKLPVPNALNLPLALGLSDITFLEMRYYF